MACPVQSDLQVKNINIALSVLLANILLTVSDGKFWFRLLNKDLHTLEWAGIFTPTYTHNTQRKLKGSLLRMYMHKTLDSICTRIFISYKLKSDEHIYNLPIQ